MSAPLRGQAIMEMRRGSGALARLSVGSDQLDAVLQGGLPRYSAVIISGLPGTGKMILSPQAAFANAQAGRTCLYLTTLAEPPLKMLRFLQGFTFFQPDLIATRVRYGDLGAVLRTDGPADVLTQVVGLLREHRPELVVIDSFIFKAKQARAIYDALDIAKCEIEKGQA